MSELLGRSSINFDMQNAKATQVNANTCSIYMPCSPSDNEITVQISSDKELQLSAATPVEETGAAHATGSLFYLNVKELGLSDDELEGLEVSLEGWTAKVYTDTKEICLAPSTDTTLSKGQKLTVNIGNLSAGESRSSSASLYMSYYRWKPVTARDAPYVQSCGVILQPPPTGHADLHNALNISLSSGNSVVQSLSDDPQEQVENSLTLTFSGTTTVSAGPDTVFTINFVYSQDPQDSYGYGALTTVGNADKIQVNHGNGVTGWTTKLTQQDPQNPAWTLKPSNGQHINGLAGTVDFDISKIVTPFGSGSTVMIVSYRNVPGYDDGAFALLVEKEARVFIDSFEAKQKSIERGATVDLSWDASHQSLTLWEALVEDEIDLPDDSDHYPWQSWEDIAGNEPQLVFQLKTKGVSSANVAYSTPVPVNITR